VVTQGYLGCRGFRTVDCDELIHPMPQLEIIYNFYIEYKSAVALV
jgi:hypothetical protein